MLAVSFGAALKIKAITSSSMKRVVVDTIVEDKNIKFPTVYKLYEEGHRLLVRIVHHHDFTLQQAYGKTCRELLPKISRYAYAKQYRRMSKAIKRVRGFTGRVLRDFKRQIVAMGIELTESQFKIQELGKRLLSQTCSSKNKINSLQQPHLDCISKGKFHKRQEFVSKVSIAMTEKEPFIFGARNYSGNPYDGHTLGVQLNQVYTLTDIKPDVCYVDRGYNGSGVTDTRVVTAGQKNGISRTDKR